MVLTVWKTPNGVRKRSLCDVNCQKWNKWHVINNFIIVGKKNNQTAVPDAEQEIPTLRSSDNAGNSINFFPVWSVYHRVAISRSASEIDDRLYLSRPIIYKRRGVKTEIPKKSATITNSKGLHFTQSDWFVNLYKKSWDCYQTAQRLFPIRQLS